MSTRVDFYILTSKNKQETLLFACKLLEKIYSQQHRCYVHCSNEAEAHSLDELLWTYNDISFIPHNLYGEGPTPAPAIQIGHQLIPTEHRDILFNLNTELPASFQRFRRVIELVPDIEENKLKARDKFKHYREQQCELTTHDLTK